MTGIAPKRGCVFGATHDVSFPNWVDDPKWKRCLLFNLSPPNEADDVHYFIATSGVHYYREHPHLLSDVLIVPAGVYDFFKKETAIDFRTLWVAPMKKLQQNHFEPLGELSPADIQRCAETAGNALQLERPFKRLLGLR